MEELANLFHGFAVVLQPFNIMVMVLGIVLGVLIGVLPGLGGANGIAILLPLTFSMSPTSAIIMLSCIYWGALFGGAITSVLFNIPASRGRWRRPSTATRWRSRARRARR
jgi:putative tricarboxylic transport membrane protein